jgi:hypothetical protein
MTLPTGIVAGVACFCLHIASARTVGAQPPTSSFVELVGKLRPGTTVFVTDDGGRKIKGKIARLSASSLELLSGGTQEDLAESRVLQITERLRNTRKGAKYGFLIGAGLGVLSVMNVDCPTTETGHTRCENTDSLGFMVPMVFAIGGIGSAVGSGIGAISTHEHLIYRATGVHPGRPLVFAPFVSKEGAGLTASLRF